MRLLHASSWWLLSTLSLFWCFCADIKNYILSFCTSKQIICPVILGPSSRFKMSTFPWYTADERWWGSKFAHICSTSLNCDLFIHWFTSLCSILTSVSRLNSSNYWRRGRIIFRFYSITYSAVVLENQQNADWRMDFYVQFVCHTDDQCGCATKPAAR